MRKNLKKLRLIDNNLSQAEFAAKIGVSRSAYAYVESGKRGGSAAFWANTQAAFNVPDADMFALMKNDEERTKQCETKER